MNWLLSHSPAQALFRRRAERSLAVLAYHGVLDRQRFEAQLDHLQRFTSPVTLDQVIDALHGRLRLPPRATLITFDDGDRTIREVAMEPLRSRGLSAVVFVIAGLIDSDRPPWWTECEALVRAAGSGASGARNEARAVVDALKTMPNRRRLEALAELRAKTEVPISAPQLTSRELRELESAGIVVGSHTVSHPSLPRCESEEVRAEIVGAHETLAAALGRPPRVSAYPYGHYDPRAASLLDELGYGAAFLFDHRLSACPVPDRFRVSRVRVNSHTGLDRFRIILSGLHPWLHRLRGGR